MSFCMTTVLDACSCANILHVYTKKVWQIQPLKGVSATLIMVFRGRSYQLHFLPSKSHLNSLNRIENLVLNNSTDSDDLDFAGF